MTCEQVRSYFEDHLRDTEKQPDRGVAEHLSRCADCAWYIQAQRELGRNLRMVCQSAPVFPESLDAAVLARYRRQVAEREGLLSEVRPRRVLLASPWALGAVAAVVLAGVAVSFFLARKPVSTTHVAAASSAASGVADPVAQVAAPTPTRPEATPTRHPVASRTAHSQATKEAEAPIRVTRSLPDGFRSLMYCDALSCGGDMEMIRVQLPASSMYRQVPGFIQTSGSVTADVLVGQDGVARGIRLEEIEF